MARLTRKEMEDIVAKEMPGYRIADRPPGPELDAPERPARARPEAQTPDVDALRRKYFGDEAGGAVTETDGDTTLHNEGDDDADEEIVPLEPTRTDVWDRARRPKSVVFSHKQRRIVGYQG